MKKSGIRISAEFIIRIVLNKNKNILLLLQVLHPFHSSPGIPAPALVLGAGVAYAAVAVKGAEVVGPPAGQDCQ